MDKEDVISISQLFAHITANRNVDRVPKQGFDLVKLTENTTAKFSEILTELSLSPVKEELDGNSELIWAIEALKDTYEEAIDLLKKEKEFGQQPRFRHIQFAISGTNLINEVE